MFFDVLIVGSGHSGAHAAVSLRQLGYAGKIAIMGEEADAPYERPPLSKDYLAGTRDSASLSLRPITFWREREVTLIAGEQVVEIDPAARVVRAASGRTVGYGILVWAAGGHARQIGCTGATLAGIHHIRSRADVDRLRAELDDARRVAIIGGGYIGLEAAAVLRKLGKPVTLFEALPRVLARVAGEPLSQFYEAEHRAQGVDLRTGIGVVELEGTSRVEAILTANGDRIEADLVIVGIGIVPSILPLLAAGADGGNGVNVDQFCRTNLPDVYAIGDCALHYSCFAPGAPVRIESVQNATDMALTAARSIVGQPQPYAATPWFWSHQYDLKLQTVGLSIGYDKTIVRGDPAARSFSLVYLRNRAVIAFDCVNRVKDYVQGKALVEARAQIDPALLADPDLSLKTLLQEV